MGLKERLSAAKYILLDMDGTIYIGEDVIGDMRNTLATLRSHGKKLIYLTNNSSKTSDEYRKKLERLSLFGDGDEVYTSGMATAEFLNAERKGKSVCLLSTEALRRDFERQGINVVGRGADIAVLAYDTELTYEKLCDFTYSLKKGAEYIATHPDVNCPASEVFVPDAGAFMKLIEASVGRTPDKIVGKPFSGMGESLMRRFSARPQDFFMVGDRLNTDIQFGNNCKFNTILVLSGESTREDVERSSARPDFVLDSLNDVVRYL